MVKFGALEFRKLLILYFYLSLKSLNLWRGKIRDGCCTLVFLLSPKASLTHDGYSSMLILV